MHQSTPLLAREGGIFFLEFNVSGHLGMPAL